MADPGFADAYAEARERIDAIDQVVRSLDSAREERGLSKAELARRIGVRPESMRRLGSAPSPKPTRDTLVAVAQALKLRVKIEPERRAADILATVKAVAAAPPPRFAGGGSVAGDARFHEGLPRAEGHGSRAPPVPAVLHTGAQCPGAGRPERRLDHWDGQAPWLWLLRGRLCPRADVEFLSRTPRSVAR